MKLKDFRNPPAGEMQADRFGNHTVKVYFHGKLTEEEQEEYKEELSTKWDKFEETYEEE